MSIINRSISQSGLYYKAVAGIETVGDVVVDGDCCSSTTSEAVPSVCTTVIEYVQDDRKETNEMRAYFMSSSFSAMLLDNYFSLSISIFQSDVELFRYLSRSTPLISGMAS